MGFPARRQFVPPSPTRTKLKRAAANSTTGLYRLLSAISTCANQLGAQSCGALRAKTKPTHPPSETTSNQDVYTLGRWPGSSAVGRLDQVARRTLLCSPHYRLLALLLRCPSSPCLLLPQTEPARRPIRSNSHRCQLRSSTDAGAMDLSPLDDDNDSSTFRLRASSTVVVVR